MTVTCTMILGDCLEVMPTLPKASANMVFADLPYACTRNSWDRPIDLDKYWAEAARVGIPNCPYLLTASMAFSVNIIRQSNVPFRYDLVWHKSIVTGFLNANKMPMRAHENVLVFYNRLPCFNPQKTASLHAQGTATRYATQHSSNYNKASFSGDKSLPWVDSGQRLPTSVLTVRSEKRQNSRHPTQKPVALLDWLIRTYSNQGGNVLDPTSGSGTTAISAVMNGRNVTCIEKDAGYFDASLERVRKTIQDNKLDVRLEVAR